MSKFLFGILVGMGFMKWDRVVAHAEILAEANRELRSRIAKTLTGW